MVTGHYYFPVLSTNFCEAIFEYNLIVILRFKVKIAISNRKFTSDLKLKRHPLKTSD